MIKVYAAVLESTQLANANVLHSKKDCTDPCLKKEIDRAQAAIGHAIKKFLNEESSTLTLKFVEKRATRKRSGEFLNHLYLP